MRTNVRYSLAVLLGFALGLALSIAGGLGAATLVASSRLESVWPALGSCKAPAFFGLLIGAPAGCVAGVAIVGMMLLPLGRAWLGAVVGLVLYDGAVLTVLFTPALSGILEYVVLLVPAVLATAGFHLVCKRKPAPPA